MIMVSSLLRGWLVKLILTRRHDQLQHLPHTLLGLCGVGPIEMATLAGIRQQFLTALLPNFQGPHQVERRIHELLWRNRAAGFDTVDHEAHAGAVGVPHHLGSKVDPAHERTTVDPLSASMPALDRKSTRLNSSHLGISYAVFCLKKK